MTVHEVNAGEPEATVHWSRKQVSMQVSFIVSIVVYIAIIIDNRVKG